MNHKQELVIVPTAESFVGDSVVGVAVHALETLAAAASAAATALQTPAAPEFTKHGVELPSGERVLDYCRRRLYSHAIAAWIDDSRLADTDQVDLEVDFYPNDEPFTLVHWPGTKLCAVIFPSNGGSGNCPWRIQEFEADATIIAFMKSKNAWN